MMNKHLEFSVESLERRQLLAGNVQVVLTGQDDLRIMGDSQDNTFEVRTDGAGSLKRFVISPTGTTTINGQQDTVFIGHDELRDLKINLNGGDDNLGMYVLSRPRQFRQAVIKAGAGNDRMTMFGHIGNGYGSVKFSRNVRILLGSGDDSCDMYNAEVEGNVTIIGGSTQDSISVLETTVAGKLTANLKGGDVPCSLFPPAFCLLPPAFCLLPPASCLPRVTIPASPDCDTLRY